MERDDIVRRLRQHRAWHSLSDGQIESVADVLAEDGPDQADGLKPSARRAQVHQGVVEIYEGQFRPPDPFVGNWPRNADSYRQRS